MKDDGRTNSRLDNVTEFALLLSKKRVKKICIEAGHIYVDEEPNGQHHQSLRIGAVFAEILGRHLPNVKKMLFVDDYNPKTSCLDIGKYVETAAELGFRPDILVWESSLCRDAKHITDRLLKDGAAHLDGQGHVCTRKQNIRLKYATGKFTCSALDAALYLHKLDKHDFAITILPDGSAHEYRKQQRNVRRLLRILGRTEVPIANVYFDIDGNFVIGISD